MIFEFSLLHAVRARFLPTFYTPLDTTARPWPERERRSEFHNVDYDEPHKARTQQILAAHPEIVDLFGSEWKTKWMVLATVILQVSVAVLVKDQSWPVFLLAAYVIGATANQYVSFH